MRSLLAIAVAALIALPAAAHEYTLGALKIAHPYSRAMPPMAPTTGAFFAISNNGKTADKLLGASSPLAASVELHSHQNDNGVMRMRQIEGGIAVPAGATVTLAPGGLHVMLLGVKQQPHAGDKFPLTLKFDKAGEINVEVKVEDGGAMPMQHDGMKMPQ
ncbi:copper chaperone PCu(A)C [Vogesella oryzae]|uniref:copper chaperone PCu(A)C n=1 Tax=Vogesella oryzae TaxID=1735285 RepID=UPI001581B2DF|nr:copper chaperone PCu(A)C [Vogesella oryzae]